MLGPSFAAATRFSRKQEKARCNAADLWHLEHCHSRARLVQAAGAPGVTAHHASHGYPISPDGRKNWNWFDVGQVIGDHGGCLLLLLLIIAHFHLKALGWRWSEATASAQGFLEFAHSHHDLESSTHGHIFPLDAP